MERAQTLEITSGLLQPQVFRNEVDQIEAILDIPDGVLLQRGHRRKLTGRSPPPSGRDNERQAERLRRFLYSAVVRHERREIATQPERRRQVDRIERSD